MAGHSLVPGTVDGHINLVRDITPRYWKGASDLTIRGNLTFYLLRKYGSMTFKARSHSQVWNAKIREPQVLPLVDNIPTEFVNQDTDVQFYIGVKGMGASDFMPELERLMAEGAPEMVVDRYRRKTEDMVSALDRRLEKSFYVDGNDAANLYDYVGIKTPLSYSTSGMVTAHKVAHTYNATYAGQSTALGVNGGSWSANMATKPNAVLARDWPFGQGDPSYDGISPVVWNYSSSQYSATTTWAANCVNVIADAVTVMNHRGGYSNKGGAPIVIVMSSDMFVVLKNTFRANQRQIMPWTDGDLGFPQETLMIDGALCMSDYNVPAGEAYMWAPQYVEMFNLHEGIYKEYGPEYSMRDRGHLYFASAYGNFKYQPKYLNRFISLIA
jgi:hypothetical protein